ncbi:MAG: heat-inducible transcriptional repressor HrcA [Elusimicrobiota bacterium]
MNERKQKVLQSVIHCYIQTARPVPSKLIAEKFTLGLSPATIRSVLSELEEEGYLVQPHTSAGRIPTDKGYRYYVDSMLEIQRLTIDEEERLRTGYETHRQELEETLVQTSKMLSVVSQYTGFVMAPKLEKSSFKHLELINLEPKKILAILVTSNELVKHRVLDIPHNISSEKLREIAQSLNRSLKGLTLSEIRQKIVEKIDAEKRLQEEMLELVRQISLQAFDIGDELYLEGAANILNLPDFADYQKIRSIFNVIEEKKFFARILKEDIYRRGASGSGVEVFIGEENLYPELRECSVITSTYKLEDRVLGILGILGPKRMEYGRMIALVDRVSRSLDELFVSWGGKEIDVRKTK